jgi:hypothetical protein
LPADVVPPLPAVVEPPEPPFVDVPPEPAPPALVLVPPLPPAPVVAGSDESLPQPAAHTTADAATRVTLMNEIARMRTPPRTAPCAANGNETE